jgi:hypothetical protein
MDVNDIELQHDRVSETIITLTRRLSVDKINFEQIDQSLVQINDYNRTTRNGRLFLVSFLVMRKGVSNDDSEFRHFTLRQLFNHLETTLNEFDIPDETLNALKLASQTYPQTTNLDPQTLRKRPSMTVGHNPLDGLMESNGIYSHNGSIRRPSFRNPPSQGHSAYVNSSLQIPVFLGDSKERSERGSEYSSIRRSSILNNVDHSGGHSAMGQGSVRSSGIYSAQPLPLTQRKTDSSRRSSICVPTYMQTSGLQRTVRSNSNTPPMTTNSSSNKTEQSILNSGRNSVLTTNNTTNTQQHWHDKLYTPQIDIQTAPVSTQRLIFRDLRRLDFQFNNLDHSSVLIVRRHCIVFSFYPITAIVLADQVLLSIPQKTINKDGSKQTAQQVN